jgi:hypothetical protein
VLDDCVGSGKDQSFVPIVQPPNEVWRLAVLSTSLEDLGISLGLTDAMALDHQSVAWFGLHAHLRCGQRAPNHQIIIEAKDPLPDSGDAGSVGTP